MKPDLGSIDCDVLVSLGLERIHQVGPFKRDSAALGNFLELLELSLGQGAGVMEQSADESRFPMVHVTNNDNLELFRRSDTRLAVDGSGSRLGNAHGGTDERRFNSRGAAS